MNPTNNKSHIHRKNKERIVESDFERKCKVMDIIKDATGLFPLQDETVPIPDVPGRYADHREPDLVIKNTNPTYLIELQGPCHNWETEQPMRRMDIRKHADYEKLGSDYKIVEIFGGPDNQYPEDIVIAQLKKAGVPFNEFVISAWLERKQRCQRY